MPLASVVVPARNCAEQLRQCLLAIRNSDFSDYEIIVVDDASTDATGEVAQEFDARYIHLNECRGPANARNAGANAAQGSLLVFLDADVIVHPMAIGTLVNRLADDQSLAAVFGSYDDTPSAGNFLSQFRNLLHHFTHQTSSIDAQTFWAGCGSVRASVFRRSGGFDPRYRYPTVEDIEFGYRLKKEGYRIALEKQALCTHMKRWRLWNMVTTDVFRRGLPWTILIFERGMLNNDLNLKNTQRLSILCCYALLFVSILATMQHPTLLIALIGFLIGLLCLDAWSDERTVPASIRIVAILALAGWGVIFAFISPQLAFLGAALVFAIFILNWRCYSFFAGTRYPLFAIAVLPLHIVYFLAAGLGLLLGGATYIANSTKKCVFPQFLKSHHSTWDSPP